MNRALLTLAVVAAYPVLTAASCTTTQGPPVKMVTQTVEVPVYRSCVPSNTPPAPTYADTRAALKAATPDQGNHLMQSEWPRRDARLSLLEQIVGICR